MNENHDARTETRIESFLNNECMKLNYERLILPGGFSTRRENSQKNPLNQGHATTEDSQVNSLEFRMQKRS